MDFEIQRCTRHCSATGRELAPDEVFYSALVEEGGQTVRHDFCAEAWQGPPSPSMGWWKSRMPGRTGRRINWAPSDVMLEYFEELADKPDRQDVRYVLALLMIRRRIVRMEETKQDEQGHEVLALHCARREKNYEVLVTVPDEAKARQIQEELAALLVADAG
ncbi:MAG: hypothetical protein K8T91_26515 [Planctomycetes bacterium]|nr:hypothetical protein [Planctomycetota bacterium]